MIHGLVITPLKIINTSKGNIYHALKCSENEFSSFGEAYFSEVAYKEIKGWKKHKDMTLNLIVPLGAIKFVVYDDRVNSATFGFFFEIIISRENYSRVTIPPQVWVAFQGVERGINMLLNIASIEHDPQESEIRDITHFNYNW
jgi:dTDP-4-dehydrorhamnose 3,5-epimerase